MTSIEEKVEKKGEPIVPRRRNGQIIRNGCAKPTVESGDRTVMVNESVEHNDSDVRVKEGIDSVLPVEIDLPEYLQMQNFGNDKDLSNIPAKDVLVSSSNDPLNIEKKVTDLEKSNEDVPLSEVAFDEEEVREIDYTFLYEKDLSSNGLESTSTLRDCELDATFISKAMLNKTSDGNECFEKSVGGESSVVGAKTSVEELENAETSVGAEPVVEAKTNFLYEMMELPAGEGAGVEKKYCAMDGGQGGFLSKSQMQIIIPGQVNNLKPVRKMAPLRINKQDNSFELKEYKGAVIEKGRSGCSFAQEEKCIPIVEPIKIFKSVKVNASIVSEHGDVLVKGKPQEFTNIEFGQEPTSGKAQEVFGARSLAQIEQKYLNESVSCVNRIQEGFAPCEFEHSETVGMSCLADDVGTQLLTEQEQQNVEKKVKVLKVKLSNEKSKVGKEKVEVKVKGLKALAHGVFWGYMFEVEKSMFNPVSFFLKSSSSLVLAFAHIFVPIIMGFVLVNHNIQSYSFFTSGSAFVVGVKMVWLWSVCFFSWSVLFMIAGRTIDALKSDATDFQRIGQGFFSPMNWNEREKK